MPYTAQSPTASTDGSRYLLCLILHLPAFFGDVAVGAVATRLDKVDEASGAQRMYIMTLGVLPAYRHHGIGRRLLQYALELAQSPKLNVTEITLDVQVTNDAALAFYQRHGFTIVREEKNYYKNVQPADAYHLAYTVTRH